MTDQTADTMVAAPTGASFAPLMFGITVFASAALIFLVEPMIAKLVLPTLGGSPMVWNTCMAFFQGALLIGYAYAHLLQRIKSLKTQVIVHAVVLIAAALVLPLEVSKVFGQPGELPAALWLVSVLAVTLGAPFAALSATAPLAQAWYARVRAGHADAANPYVLYAASNLGSLIALLAYPIVVEPTLSLNVQTVGWSIGYVAFVFLMVATAFSASKAGPTAPLERPAATEKAAISWKDRLIWIGLAAAPSSMMLGVTTYVTTDIASTPFLWVLPLSLYLITFIMAFAAKPPLPKFYILVLQGALAVAVAFGFGMGLPMVLQLSMHMAMFFFTALMCHSALAERRPHPSRLTEFYLLMSVGGVIGGAFNAFLAPVIFNGIVEYPLVVVLACLARPWAWKLKMSWVEWGLITVAILAFACVFVSRQFYSHMPAFIQAAAYTVVPKLMLIVGVVCVFLVRDRGLIFTALVGILLLTSITSGGVENTIKADRSFFGVLKLTRVPIGGFSNEARVLAHGTTLHGVQFAEPELACTPRVYYAPKTPIGQVFAMARAHKGNLTVGAVGMGVGSVAGFNQAGDYTRFFEIDQQVIDMATNPQYLTYIKGCAKGKVDWVLGDARLKLDDEATDKYDVLLIDAFSSDAVPAHLLTRQALELYLTRVKPDGVVIMHLSNRHLDLMSPVAATAMAAGGFPLEQRYPGDPVEVPQYIDSPENVIIIGRNRAALAPYEADPRWQPAQSNGVRVWTDDYTNIFGSMVRSMTGRG